VEEDLSDEGDSKRALVLSDAGGAEACGEFSLGGGIGVPSHMALRVIAILRCFFQCLSFMFFSFSSMSRPLRAGVLP
jgi:hypothetical protein